MKKEKSRDMNHNEFSIYISKVAIKSLLYEVTASPKPGLVDRFNSGAHRDMDIFTFLDSSVSLVDYFHKCTMAGIKFDNENKKILLEEIRPIGIEAERSMFEATRGVNTHKGLIFSLGIICSAAGCLYNINGEINQSFIAVCNMVKEIAKDITKELDEVKNKENLTYGEKLYLKYGVKGIRGEVESGFETVRQYSMPIIKDLLSKERHINDVLVHVLLKLMAYSEDSNILGRHDMETLDFVKEKARAALEHGGYLTSYGKIFVEEMDKYFIQKNISPGGSADLLAVTLMLYMLENGQL